MVVIGGLISATILTLIVLPALYVMFERRWHKGHHGRKDESAEAQIVH